MSRWYPPPSRPRPAAGIRARSRRGEIGESWWSRRFIEILESFDIGARLTRGRSYARAGQVLDLAIEPGMVTARVQGSRVRPYQVQIGTLTLPDKDWVRVEEAMAARAAFLARLLAGEMPHDIEQAFTDTRLTLFPASARDLTTDCSCPDWSNPCKHVAATYYLLAEAFDADPFLIFRWRGRDRDVLLDRLRARRAGGAAEEPEGELWDVPAPRVRPLDEELDRFWQAAGSIEQATSPPRAAAVPDAILRTLEPAAVAIGDRVLGEVLSPAYPAIVAAAERRALHRDPR